MNLKTRLTAWWQSRKPAPLGPLPPPPRGPAAPDVLEGPPMVGQDTLRDWMVHHHRRNVDVWSSVVAEFYTRAERDPEIRVYFVGVDMAELQRHFMRALVVVTHIGLTVRSADSIGQKHAHLGITDEHFVRVVGVLLDVLTDYGVPRGAIPQLGKIAEVLRRRIVTA